MSKGIVGIDFDRKDIPEPFTELINETLTTVSIRGCHLFFRSPRKKLPYGFADTLKDEYNVEFRYETQYFLLPLSIHPTSTKKEIRFYDFVDWTAPILNIKDLMAVS